MQDLALLQDEHLPRGRIVTRGQVIKIHSACHLLTELVPTIRVNCFRPTLVDRCDPMPNIKRTNNPTTPVVDCQGYESVLRQPIGYPRLRVKRIRVVGKQYRLSGGQRDVIAVHITDQ